ncbi:MAG: phosphodiester glycosidase family protein, partial [Ginsengibacter sp.]
MKHILFVLYFFLGIYSAHSQKGWVNIDSLYQPLPASFKVFKSIDSVDGKPNVMYYAIADLKDRDLIFTSDTTTSRRLTPSAFYEKNDQPLLVVNTSFFTFNTHQNLNVVVKDGEILSYNQHSNAGRGKDTLTYAHPFLGAIGISKKRKADVAWTFSDSSKRFLYASQMPVPFLRDSIAKPGLKYIKRSADLAAGNDSRNRNSSAPAFTKWKVRTAVGGGPVLVQNGEVKITNNEEMKFAGKAIDDLHPRTAMGYTADNKLVVFVCEGRAENAAGLSLTQLAKVMKNIGCVEALNLDGGGSTCMLINGKETNIPSSKGEQRQIPSVFLI